jgi:hypothetical protein
MRPQNVATKRGGWMVLPVKLAEDLFVSETRQLAITALVRDRCKELGLSSPELVRRCGYKNVSKGLRRLEQLCKGNFKSSVGLVRSLPAALKLPVAVVKEAIEKTERYLHDSAEAAWRAAFRSHAVIITQRTIPQPIFMACMIGLDTLLRVDFDSVGDEGTYVSQSVKGILAKLRRWASSSEEQVGLFTHSLPAFGRPIGFAVNYSCDFAVRFDLEGNALEVPPGAYRIGQTEFLLRGKPVPAEVLRKLFPLE